MYVYICLIIYENLEKRLDVCVVRPNEQYSRKKYEQNVFIIFLKQR